jgi:SsrA-binding protein
MAALVHNKKADFNYEIVERYEAGIELFGFEVKSLKKGTGSLEGSFVVLKNGELFLKNSYIPPYQEKNTPESYDPYRMRKLLMKKSEIEKIAEDKKGQGLTIIPISWYNKNNKVKLEVALARGKKKYDKRETIKKRDQERDLGRRFK